jgi:spore coat protein A
VIATFDLPGRYEWHCHILSHEDHDMMRPFIVGETKTTNAENGAKANVTQNKLNVYPNPFAVSTNIQFEVATKSKVSIKVYDLQGREVGKVFEGDKLSGIYNIAFNATVLSSGVYICQLLINKEALQQKLIIQK